MSPIKTAISFLLLAASAVAAPVDTNTNDSELFRRQDYTFNCDAAPPAVYPNQGGLIKYSTAESTLHQAPLAPGLSGYPHFFTNGGDLPLGRNCDAAAKANELFEFPVFGDGHLYNWNTKRNDRDGENPGPARVLYTKFSKDFCGVIAHNGPGNIGDFHICGVTT